MIRLLPLGEFDRNLLLFLKDKLELKFKDDVAILKNIVVPRECYNPIRRQYNSTCILRKLEPLWLTLAVTEVDL